MSDYIPGETSSEACSRSLERARLEQNIWGGGSLFLLIALLPSCVGWGSSFTVGSLLLRHLNCDHLEGSLTLG